MAYDWDIREPASQCVQCGRAFVAGAPVYSALVEQGESFARVDRCEACWQSAESVHVFSRWRTITPQRDTPIARRVNGRMVLEFFHRLEGETDRRRACFRYVLALMLMRKKVLRLDGTEREGADEWLILDEAGTGVRHRVVDPRLDRAEVAALTEEVGRLLNVRAGEDDTPVPAPVGVEDRREEDSRDEARR